MTLGPTHYNWRPDVKAVVERLERRYPRVKCNTYVDHPWPGWDGVSVDCWGSGGRGDAIPRDLGLRLLEHALQMRHRPPLRHWIYLHTLWTSFGGESYWAANDHSHQLRHVHLTFWK